MSVEVLRRFIPVERPKPGPLVMREPGFGSRSLSDQRGQIMPLPSSGS